MSDSKSVSSEPSPPNSRAASPKPETEQPNPEETRQKEKSGVQGTPEPIDADVKPPLVESDGVRLLWPDPSDFVDEPAEDGPITSFDYVFVPGIYDNLQYREEAGPDSPSSRGIELNLALGNNRILKFEYAAKTLFSGVKCREAIRNCALQLLRGVLALRRDAKRRRLIAFMAFDLGGILVKDALVAAILDPGAWPDVADMSRILIFFGCPHRSTSYLDMEDRLCRFVYESSTKAVSDVTPSASSIAGLAAATIEVNGLFVDSKASLRCRITSIHAGLPLTDEDTTVERISSVFDNYSGTLGVPFEKRFVLTGSDGSEITSYLDGLGSVLDANYTADAMSYERKLLSVASPIDPFRSAASARDSSSSVTETSAYKTWLDLPGPQILHIHGPQGTRDAAEQVFYALDEKEHTEDTIVLYFSFDQGDVRRDSIRDMASTFMAQIICQFPHNAEWTHRLFTQLDLEGGWTDADLIYWLERFRFNDQFEHAIYVINHFDECTKGSQQFLQKFKYLSANSEGQWKIVLTSHKPGALLGKLSDTALTILDLSTSTDSTNSSAETEGDIKRLMHSRPELLLQESLVRQELAEIAGIDPLARRVVIAQAGAQSDWPNRLSVRSLLEPLELTSDSPWDDSILASLLDRLLRSVKERVPALRLLLSWLLYTVRPPTIWELGTVLYLDSSTDNNVAVPPASALSHLIGNIQVWLAGIVEVEQNEVRVSHPRLRNILMSKVGLSGKKGNKSPRNVHVWDDISATAHFDIARQCLNYLSQPEVRGIVDRTGSIAAMPVHVFADRGNLCSYALQAWTYHFLKASPADQTKLASQFEFARLGTSWAHGYWALSNPITRNKKPLDSLFPVFAGLGLCNAVKPRDKDDLSCGIVEAASKGHSQTVKRLIKHNTLSEETLLEVLVAAGASEDDGLILSLIQHISSKSNSPDAIVWPISLLYRAAWLGLDRVIESLLQLRVGADPSHPIREKLKLSPLYQAIRNFHVAAVRVLINAGADVSFRTGYGKTALHLAGELGNAEIAGLLVHEGKSDIEFQDDNSRTPLYFACLYGHHAVAKELLLLGADPNMGLTTENPDGIWTPLIVAAEGGFNTWTKLLIENKVDVDLNGPTTDGTALLHAVIKGQVESCRLLLEAGANPNSPFIKTSLIVQLVQYIGSDREEKRVQILKLLLDRGVDVNAKGEDSRATIASLLDWDDIGPFYEVVLNHPGVDVNVPNTDNETPLHFATLNKDLTAVELLLARGADVNRVSNGGFTPLYHAIPKAELVDALLKAGANPSIGKYGGFTSLMYAAWFELGNEESLKLLLKHNVALETECSNDIECTGGTALTCAVVTGYTAAVRHLVDAGANLKHVGADGIPILHHAASATIDPTGKLAIVLEYLTRLDLNQTDKQGRTALHLTSIPVENMKRLVNAGADVNILDEKSQTPLNSDYISMEAAELLLKHGADPNILAPAYGGPLHRSAWESNFQMVKLLVDNEAVDINTAVLSMYGTPLISACLRWGNVEDHAAEIVQLLLSRGADVNGKGGLVGYALNAAAFVAGPAVIDILIANKASTDVKDDMGRRPAHFAARRNLETFQKVVDIGCDVGLSDITGRTTLMWAAPAGNFETAKKLLEMTPDSNIDAKDQDGWTALCWAARGPEVHFTAARTATDLAEFIKLLLERGADKRVVATGPGGKRWKPLKIARFHGALPEVVELLKGEGEPSPEDESKVGGTAWFLCDGCLLNIFGFRYCCKTCHWFDLCFKCYPHRKEMHMPGDHEFEENGPEFVEEEEGGEEEGGEEEGGEEGKASGDASTTTSSDDEIDSVEEEEEEEEEAESEKSEESS